MKNKKACILKIGLDLFLEYKAILSLARKKLFILWYKFKVALNFQN